MSKMLESEAVAAEMMGSLVVTDLASAREILVGQQTGLAAKAG